MTATTLRYEVTGRVARITLDRPERANAITLAMPRGWRWTRAPP